MVLQASALFVFGAHRSTLCRACSVCFRRRQVSTATPLPEPPSTLEYTLSHPIYTIWGSNTGVGKTLVSTGLAASVLLSPSPSPSPTKFIYIKPVQTGFPADCDSRYIFRKVSELFISRSPCFSVIASNHIIRSSVAAAEAVLGRIDSDRDVESPGVCQLGLYEEKKLLGSDGSGTVANSELICKTLFGWREAVSPHLAAEREGGVVEDSVVIETLQRCLGKDSSDKCSAKDGVWTVVETAGGIASPGPSGSLQCDLYRPFRLPAILVGDGQLGGISGTISAYESLNIRGYDVIAIVFVDHGLMNELPLLSYLRNRVPVLVLPRFPNDTSDDAIEWFDSSCDVFCSLRDVMLSAYFRRIERLHDMPKKAGDIFWWPFTQHKLVPEETVTVIDSRCGGNFSVHKVQNSDFITQQFDACASWWTQGPNDALQLELARNMGYAAARFGHVMFPENVHEPALESAELLLEGVGKGWASRVFFSDNGSTAVEIALKMGFRKFCFDHGIFSGAADAHMARRPIELKVLALKGCYHGDTLGAMEAQAPSSFTGFLQQPWYTGRGLFLDPPTVFMCSSRWNLSLTNWLDDRNLEPDDLTFSSRDDVFSKTRDYSKLAAEYSSYISQQLLLYSGLEGLARIGSLIIEPVILGSGGMHMVDPLFQSVLVRECQSRKIPVIFDEVFTGFWRLGAESAAELLGCQPDISCYGKLMTGGILPLAVTLATHPVFEAFIGESKLRALLHGHSYTAHAMGCTAAAKSIKWFRDPQTNPNLISERRLLRELWDAEAVKEISSIPAVQRVVVLGTLLAIELRADDCNAGYASMYARSLIQKLREDGVYTRPLGNVIYLMCAPCTSPDICHQLAKKVRRRLEELHQAR